MASKRTSWAPDVTRQTHPRLDWTPLKVHTTIDPADVDRMVVHSHPGAWFETYGRIVDKSKQLVAPVANMLQIRACNAVAWCIERKIPVRLILLKPRQKGCSTVSKSIIYWAMNVFDNFRAITIGREYSQTDNLWQIFKTYSTNDAFDWGFRRQVLKSVANFGNGSQAGKETAEDSEAGRSGTFHGVVATECARWREGGVANAEDILAGLLNCVPYLPGTIVIQESTARGASGPFYELWEDSLDFEEFARRHEAGESLEGRYIRVFAGWQEFPDSCDELTPQQEQQIQDSITPEEAEILQRYNLSYGHIAWRRRTIRIECQRDEQKFDREYPETPSHAFRASSPSRFNARGLSVIQAKARQTKEQWGVLESVGRTPRPNNRHFSFHPMEEFDPGARLFMTDPPRVGMRYILPVDVMEGETSERKKDIGPDPNKHLDHHRGLVMRAGYYDRDRGWRPPAVVAGTVLAPRQGVPCQWDIDVLEEHIWRLSQFYGGCLIVPESNKDRGLIRGLIKRGALIYERQTDEERGDVRSPKASGRLGFRTTGGQSENTRSWIIERLARAVREWDQSGEGIDVDLRTAFEMVSFVVGPDGKAAALPGEHDDSVIALAIGLALIDSATLYKAPPGHPYLPRDLREPDRRKVKGQYR